LCVFFKFKLIYIAP